MNRAAIELTAVAAHDREMSNRLAIAENEAAEVGARFHTEETIFSRQTEAFLLMKTQAFTEMREKDEDLAKTHAQLDALALQHEEEGHVMTERLRKEHAEVEAARCTLEVVENEVAEIGELLDAEEMQNYLQIKSFLRLKTQAFDEMRGMDEDLASTRAELDSLVFQYEEALTNSASEVGELLEAEEMQNTNEIEHFENMKTQAMSEIREMDLERVKARARLDALQRTKDIKTQVLEERLHKQHADIEETRASLEAGMCQTRRDYDEEIGHLSGKLETARAELIAEQNERAATAQHASEYELEFTSLKHELEWAQDTQKHAAAELAKVTVHDHKLAHCLQVAEHETEEVTAHDQELTIRFELLEDEAAATSAHDHEVSDRLQVVEKEAAEVSELDKRLKAAEQEARKATKHDHEMAAHLERVENEAAELTAHDREVTNRLEVVENKAAEIGEQLHKEVMQQQTAAGICRKTVLGVRREKDEELAKARAKLEEYAALSNEAHEEEIQLRDEKHLHSEHELIEVARSRLESKMSEVHHEDEEKLERLADQLAKEHAEVVAQKNKHLGSGRTVKQLEMEVARLKHEVEDTRKRTAKKLADERQDLFHQMQVMQDELDELRQKRVA